MALKERQLAADAISRIFGERAHLLNLSDDSLTKDGRKFTWANADHWLKLSVEVIVKDSDIGRISLDTTLIQQFQSEYSKRVSLSARVLSNADNIVLWPAIVLVIIFYFSSMALSRIPHRLTLSFLLFAFFFLLLTNIPSGFSDSFRNGIKIGGSSGASLQQLIVPWVLFILFLLLIALLLYLSFSAGLALGYKTPNRRTIGVELLFNGRLLTKPVLNNIIAGLLLGCMLSAIPYVVVGSNLFRNAELNALGYEDLFISRTPSLTSFVAAWQVVIFIVFAFLFPLIDVYIKNKLIGRLLSFTVLLVVLVGASSIYISVQAMILTAFAAALLLTMAYIKFDLLAIMVACMSGQAIVSSAALFSQTTSSLKNSGWNIVFEMASLAIVSLIGLFKAREPREDEIAVSPELLNTRSERERLQSEFAVARRAQQQLLPDATPRIPGLDISAVCLPSKEVGGDMYDFISLPDGKLGIVVADVSGKGVPASLYMTLTKGLLDSVSEEKTDPGEILREVNRHLYEVCRRKVFVTLFLAIVDPRRMILEYARAGHNPAIFHRPSDQKTVLLKTPGIGLGLNSGNIFDKSLKVATIQLQPDDLIFFYSDGITEAMNSKNEEYGEEQLMRVASSMNGIGSEAARDAVLADVKKFLGSVPPQDDQTLVVMRVLWSTLPK